MQIDYQDLKDEAEKRGIKPSAFRELWRMIKASTERPKRKTANRTTINQ